MTLPNLSEWALRHRSLTGYLIVVLMLAGVLAYFKLGRAEDPDYTFKAMVVRTLWPRAPAPGVQLKGTAGTGRRPEGKKKSRGPSTVKRRLPANAPYQYPYLDKSCEWVNDDSADGYAPNEHGTTNSVVETFSAN